MHLKLKSQFKIHKNKYKTCSCKGGSYEQQFWDNFNIENKMFKDYIITNCNRKKLFNFGQFQIITMLGNFKITNRFQVNKFCELSKIFFPENWPENE